MRVVERKELTKPLKVGVTLTSLVRGRRCGQEVSYKRLGKETGFNLLRTICIWGVRL